MKRGKRKKSLGNERKSKGSKNEIVMLSGDREQEPETSSPKRHEAPDYLSQLSLEILCKIFNYLPIRYVMRLDCMSTKMREAVTLHLRVRRSIDLSEHKLYGWMSVKMTDSALYNLLSRCRDLELLYGFHPPQVSNRRRRGHNLLSIPGIVESLNLCKRLRGIELSNIQLRWVQLTSPHPFKDFAAPNLQTFVMSHCAGPNNALKYVPLLANLAAARHLMRLDFIGVPYLGGLIHHIVQDGWAMGAFRSLRCVRFGTCKHALETDLGCLAITASDRLEEISIQPSLSRDSLFLALQLADVCFPLFERLHLGFVDSFPEPGTWTNAQLQALGLSETIESPALITDIGMRAVGGCFPYMKQLEIFNSPYIHDPTTWFTPGQSAWGRLTDLTLICCHTLKLREFCEFVSLLPVLTSLQLESMFREPPKGCSRVGLSAGTGMGLTSSMIFNQHLNTNNATNNNQQQNAVNNQQQNAANNNQQQNAVNNQHQNAANNNQQQNAANNQEQNAINNNQQQNSVNDNHQQNAVNLQHQNAANNQEQIAINNQHQNAENHNQQQISMHNNEQSNIGNQQQNVINNQDSNILSDVEQENVANTHQKENDGNEHQHNVINSSQQQCAVSENNRQKSRNMDAPEKVKNLNIKSELTDSECMKTDSHKCNSVNNDADKDSLHVHSDNKDIGNKRHTEGSLIHCQKYNKVFDARSLTNKPLTNSESENLCKVNQEGSSVSNSDVKFDQDKDKVSKNGSMSLSDTTASSTCTKDATSSAGFVVIENDPLDISDVCMPSRHLNETDDKYRFDTESTVSNDGNFQQSTFTKEKPVNFVNIRGSHFVFDTSKEDIISQIISAAEISQICVPSDSCSTFSGSVVNCLKSNDSYNDDEQAGSSKTVSVNENKKSDKIERVENGHVYETRKNSNRKDESQGSSNGLPTRKTMSNVKVTPVTCTSIKYVEPTRYSRFAGLFDEDSEDERSPPQRPRRSPPVTRSRSLETASGSRSSVTRNKKTSIPKTESKVTDANNPKGKSKVKSNLKNSTEEQCCNCEKIPDQMVTRGKSLYGKKKGLKRKSVPNVCSCKCNTTQKNTNMGDNSVIDSEGDCSYSKKGRNENSTSYPTTHKTAKVKDTCNNVRSESTCKSNKEYYNESKKVQTQTREEESSTAGNVTYSSKGTQVKPVDIPKTLIKSEESAVKFGNTKRKGGRRKSYCGPKHNMCDKMTSTHDPVVEHDFEQVLHIKSKTLTSLSISMVGVTDIILDNCIELSRVTGHACRVLKKVSITNSSKLKLCDFTHCAKLDETYLSMQVATQEPNRNKVVYLRPMHQIDRHLLERSLFSSKNVNYSLCVIYDYSKLPGETRENKTRVATWGDFFSSINLDLLEESDFLERSSADWTPRYPWGRQIYTMNVFSHSPETLVATLRDDVVFHCSAYDDVNFNRSLTYIWYLNAGPLPNKSAVFANHSLLVQDVQREDVGNYTCVVYTGDGTTPLAISPSATIILSYINSFVIHPKSVNVTEGETISLECVTGESAPPPTVGWQKNAFKFTQGSQYNSTFKSSVPSELVQQTSMKLVMVAHPSQNGMYRCVARNPMLNIEVRSMEASIHVRALETAPYLNVTLYQPNILAPKGSNLLLPCPISGYPHPQVTWYQDNQPLSSDLAFMYPNGTLYFVGLRAEYESFYFCEGSNRLGNYTSPEIVLQLAYIDLEFQREPDPVFVVAGQPVTLPCSPPRSYPPANVTWYRNNQPMNISVYSNSLIIVDAPNGVWDLFISNVQKDNEGEYFCVAINSFAIPMSRTSRVATLKVGGAPSFIFPPLDQRVIKGHGMSVQCVVEGDPTPRVTWYLNRVPLDEGPKITTRLNGQELHIRDIDKSFHGTFTCQASNFYGNAEMNAQVFVIVPPVVTDPLPGAEPENYVMKAGQNVTIRCAVYGDPTPNVTWYKDNILLDISGRFYTTSEGLVISNLSSVDTGQYKCLVINEGGSTQAYGNLKVQVTPQFVTVSNSTEVLIGQSLTLVCEVIADPAALVTWLFNNTYNLPLGAFLSSDNSRIMISMLSWQQVGYYTCIASNSVGSISKVIKVSLQVPPDITMVLGNTVVYLNHDTELTCVTSGIPAPDVTWYRNGEPLTSSSDGRVVITTAKHLLLRFVQTVDAGEYTCRASSSVGTTEKAVSLYVVESPLPPLLLNPVTRSSTSVTLTWTPATQRPQTIVDYYTVYLKTRETFDYERLAGNITFGKLSYVVDGLLPGTEYLFKMSATNQAGEGGKSNSRSAKTFDSGPSEPRNVEIIYVNATAIQLQWEVPETTNGVVRKYRIWYKPQTANGGKS
ncbi:hypothetical protein FSP39_012784 [Pinctada imbricata]|uniref:Uncharacterized protein n=1 Tax=Pinctada imbricata TaxID=66713 RepID=A0AA88XM36_PINIB|nr:hypothetical protein FSP39_012784 [Pinctada imbricata]